MSDPGLTLRFGVFTLDTVACKLIGPAGETQLSPLATRFLAELGKAPGEIVERSALIAALWRDDPVMADAALNRLVSEVRQAVHDDPKQPRLIQTVPRRGYRLVSASAAPEPTAPTLSARINGLSYGKLAAVAALIVLVTVALKILIDAAVPLFWAPGR